VIRRLPTFAVLRASRTNSAFMRQPHTAVRHIPGVRLHMTRTAIPLPRATPSIRAIMLSQGRPDAVAPPVAAIHDLADVLPHSRLLQSRGRSGPDPEPATGSAPGGRAESVAGGADGRTVAGDVARDRCPHCAGRRLQLWGSFSGRRRQRCLDCRRTFSDFTGTWLAHGKRPGSWTGFIDCMRLGLSVRAAGRRVGIHKDTAWRWRHRILVEHLRLGWPQLAGTVETMERLTLVCRKGERGLPPLPRTHRCRLLANRERAWLLIARDREGGTFADVTGGVQPTRRDLEEVLAPRCGRVRLLLAKRPIYAWFAAAHGFRYARAMPPFEEDSQFNIRQVFTYDRRMRAWLSRFFGVATRYLDRYLRWYALVDRPPDEPAPHDRRARPLTARG